MADQVTTSLAEAKVLVMQGLAGKAPRVNATNNHWEVYNNDTQAWVDTGVEATGDAGHSPYINGTGYWVFWSDSTGAWVTTNYKAAGRDGEDGYTPTISMQSVEGGYIITISDGRPNGTVRSYMILNGEDGVSPAVTITTITGGHRVTITDKDHPQGQSFDVMDGQGGGSSVTVDSALSTTSENPVQNKVVKAALDAKADASDIPTVPDMATQFDMSDWASGKTVDAATLKADFTSAIQRLGDVETSVDDLRTAVSQKADSADIPTKTSDLINDSGFQTAAQVQSAVDAVTAMMPYVVEEIAPTEEIIIDDGADDVPVRDMFLNIGVQQTGEGTPSSSNVRPITGFTNASAFRSGKNLLHISGREVAPSGNILNTTPRDFSKPFLYVGITVNNYYNKNNAVYSVDGEALTVMSKSGGYGVGMNIDVEPETDYVLSMGGGLTTSYAGFGFFDASGSFISFQYEDALSFRTPSNCKYVMVVLRPKDANVEVQYTNVQLERGTTATSYEAPETVFSYDFSEPVYGGTIDPVTGILSVTHANIASYNGEAINEPWFSSKDAYVSGAAPSAGAQVVYPLSTPVVYQMSKANVKTKYGENRIWGNTGTISMRYCADMKRYIDQAVKGGLDDLRNTVF